MELPRAAKLIRMLSSPSDGEVLSAARALCRMGIHDVAERVEKGPKFETAIRYARPRQTREIARLSRLVEELQSQVARFALGPVLFAARLSAPGALMQVPARRDAALGYAAIAKAGHKFSSDKKRFGQSKSQSAPPPPYSQPDARRA
jgi:hypothetical protein